jgi:Uma2 family endonuclease
MSWWRGSWFLWPFQPDGMVQIRRVSSATAFRGRDRSGSRFALDNAARAAIGIQSPRGNRWDTVRIPDVVVLPLQQWQEMGSREALIRLEDPSPLLVVEVVGESSQAADYRAKRAEYCVLGIGEYWIVDPLEEKVSLLLLYEGWYDLLELKGSERVPSKVFVELELQAGGILAADSGYPSKGTGS